MKSYNDDVFTFVKNEIIPALNEVVELNTNTTVAGCVIKHAQNNEYDISITHVWGSNLIFVSSEKYNDGDPIIIKCTNLQTAKEQTLDTVKNIKRSFVLNI